MSRRSKFDRVGLTRREALTGAAASLGLGLAAGRSGSAGAEQWLADMPRGTRMCVLTPEAVEGPFYFDPKLVRADITEGHKGTPLALTLQVVAAPDCTPIRNARVDVWHADALGMYSGYRGQGDEGVSTRGKTFLRGTQFTGSDGKAGFATIYPGWYPGRAVHIHFKVRTAASSSPAYEFTSQFYFDERLTDRVHVRAPYSTHSGQRTRNESDGPFRDGGAQLVLPVTERGQGYSASFTVGMRPGEPASRRGRWRI